jgi:hypothetical protein
MRIEKENAGCHRGLSGSCMYDLYNACTTSTGLIIVYVGDDVSPAV